MAPKVVKSKKTPVVQEQDDDNQSVASNTKTSKSKKDLPDKKRFFWEDHLPVTRKYPKLNSKEFKSMVNTLVFDLNNLLTITRLVYDGKDKTYTKKQVGSLKSVFLKHLKDVDSYHRAKAERAGSKRSESDKKNEPHYMCDNIHDYINELNFGNGLVDMLVHRVPRLSDTDRAAGEPTMRGKEPKFSLKEFVRLANTVLVGDAQTSIAELEQLAYVHAPGYLATVDAGDVTFAMKGKKVSVNDPNLQRIVEVHNAYATAFNNAYNVTSDDAGGKPMLTAKSAAALADPLKATLSYDVVDNAGAVETKTVSVADMFDRELTVTSPFTGASVTFNTSVLRNSISSILIGLINNANLTSVSGKYIDYELFNKYFGGSDPTYAAGQSIGYFMGGNDLTYAPSDADLDKQIVARYKSLNKTLNAKDMAAERVLQIKLNIGAMMPYGVSTGGKSIDNIEKFYKVVKLHQDGQPNFFNYLNDQYIAKHSIQGPDFKSPEEIATSLSYISSDDAIVDKPGATPRYGVVPFSLGATSTSLYSVPADYLSEGDRLLLEDPEFRLQLTTVHNYLQSLNSSYKAFRNARDDAEKAAAKKVKAQPAAHQPGSPTRTNASSPKRSKSKK